MGSKLCHQHLAVGPLFHTVFARVYHYAIYLSSARKKKSLYHHNNMRSGESFHVLRFTDFDHRRERRRLEYAFLTNAARSQIAHFERSCSAEGWGFDKRA